MAVDFARQVAGRPSSTPFNVDIVGNPRALTITLPSAIADAIEESYEGIGAIALQELKQQAPVATGRLADSFYIELIDRPSSTGNQQRTLVVRSRSKYEPLVRSGSEAPRARPPLQRAGLGGISLLDWVKLRKLRPTWPSAYRSGRTGGRRRIIRNAESQARAVAFVIQNKIATLGIEPNFYNLRINIDRITNYIRQQSELVAKNSRQRITQFLRGGRIVTQFRDPTTGRFATGTQVFNNRRTP